MFISEFEKKESLWNLMSKIYKNCDAKKTPELAELFVGLFEGK